MAVAERTPSPKTRPSKLTPVAAASGGATPKSTSAGDVLEWAESLRDRYEAEGQLLTVRGLILSARSHLPPETAPQVVRVLKEVYKKEYEAERGSANESESAAAKPKTRPAPAKEKPAPKKAPVKEKPVPKKVPVKAAKAVPAKPSRNGDGYETVPVKGNKTRIPVSVEKRGTKMRVQIAGHPMRAVFRWMGKENWTFDQAKKLLEKTGLSELHLVGSTNTLESVIRDHMGSGRHGDAGWHHRVPDIDKETAAVLRSAAGVVSKSKKK